MNDECTVRLLPGTPVVETVYAGHVGREDLERLAQQTFELAQAHGATRVLSNCERLQGGHTYADLMHVAMTYAPRAARDAVREAVVLPVDPASTAAIRFWETAAANRGLNVRLFSDRDAALAWLVSG